MSNTTKSILTTLLLGTALATPAAAAPHNPGKQLPHYVLFDVGSFGGRFGLFCAPGCRELNRHGDAVGMIATAADDPFAPYCFYDCHVDHAFEWKNGGTSDLGAIQSGVSSFALAVNDKGLAAGVSQNGEVDADTGVWEGRAVVWKSGKIKDLGTLGGTQSTGNGGINNQGQVPVVSSNSDSNDPYINVPQANCIWLPTTTYDCGGLDFAINALFLPVTTQMHGAIWSKDLGLRDAGTLGGPDSTMVDINDSGQAVGWSYTSYNAGSSGVPETHAFLWDNGLPKDLGTLGGTFSSAMLVNNNGQVVGTSNIKGDAEVHSFLWDHHHSRKMQDLGTFGGTVSHPNAMNDRGDVVGVARTADDVRLAFYWHNGQLNNLGAVGDDPASEGDGINNKGMIVGTDFVPGGDDLGGWISNQGGPVTDLNTLIRRPRGLYVMNAKWINDRGVIVGEGITKKGAIHPVVLVPENALDILSQMNKAMGKGAHELESAAAPTRSEVSRMPPRHCVRLGRLRPDHCRRG